MQVDNKYLEALMSKEINRIEFLILCYHSLYNKWPDVKYCINKFKIKKTAYYSAINNAKYYSAKTEKVSVKASRGRKVEKIANNP